jgi:hypothetical protein
MLDPDTNLPEWVQSKITLAEDYIVTAANYMDGEMNEEVEQIDELSSGLVRRYGGKAIRAHLTAKAKGDTATALKRAKGVNLASAKAFPDSFLGIQRELIVMSDLINDEIKKTIEEVLSKPNIGRLF